MKITPFKDYKKPLYAIGIGTALLAASLSGCTDPDKSVSYAGDIQTQTETTRQSEVFVDGMISAPEPTGKDDASEAMKPIELVGIVPAPEYAPEESSDR